MFWLSQSFAFAGFALVVVAMTLKNRQALLVVKLFSSAAILASYWLLGAAAGVLVAVLSLVRGVLAFWLCGHETKRKRRVAMGVLIVLSLLLHGLFFTPIVSVLAAAASVISIFCFFCRRMFWMRLLSIVTSLCEIVLNLLILNPMNIAVELFTIGACVFGIVCHDVVWFRVRKLQIKKGIKKSRAEHKRCRLIF